MSDTKQVAPRRMILSNPEDPSTGIVVAAGDEIPAFAAGYVENTPNKVDAARNHDVADAADQAINPRPAERVIQTFGLGAEETAEIHDRVAKNREQFDRELREANDPQGWLPREKFFEGSETRSSKATSEDTAKKDDGSGDGNENVEGPPLAKLTVPQLDKLAEALGDGKPEDYSGNKAEKVAALEGKVTQSDINRIVEAG